MDLDTRRGLRHQTTHGQLRWISVATTPLYYAALCGLSWLARYLITSRAKDVNARNDCDGTPLHTVSYEGWFAAARVLLDYVGK
jgi:hypothetical protein